MCVCVCVLDERGKEQVRVHIGQVGINERNPKRCRFVGKKENSCVVRPANMFVLRVGLEVVWCQNKLQMVST